MAKLKDPRRERFAQEYVVDNNGTQAAIRSGYSEKSAHVTASRLLSDAKVKARIEELAVKLVQKIEKKAEITRERVMEEYAKLAFFDVRKLFDAKGEIIPIHKLDADTAAAIAGFEMDALIDKGEKDEEGKVIRPAALLEFVKKFKISDKKGALDSIAKMMGYMVDKHEVTGKDGGPIETNELSDTEAARRLAFILARAAKEQESKK